MAPAALPRNGDMRRVERFHIECLVSAKIGAEGKGLELRGKLRDIGTGGARFCLDRRLKPGTPVVLRVHFPNPGKGVTTLRFEGVVSRSQWEPQHETVVRFRSGGKLL